MGRGSSSHFAERWPDLGDHDNHSRQPAARMDEKQALVEQLLSAWINELVSQPRPPAGAKVIVSGDHGIRPGRQSAALIAYTLTPAPMFWLLGEVCCDPSNLKATTPREDAQNIKTMLEQNGLSWEHVDFWSFDRAADSHRQDVRKDNKRLRNELAAVYGVEQDRFPRIDVPHKSAGSFITGFSALNLIFSQQADRCISQVRRIRSQLPALEWR